MKTTHSVVKLDEAIVVAAEHALGVADTALSGGYALLEHLDSIGDLNAPGLDRIDPLLSTKAWSRRRRSNGRYLRQSTSGCSDQRQLVNLRLELANSHVDDVGDLANLRAETCVGLSSHIFDLGQGGANLVAESIELCELERGLQRELRRLGDRWLGQLRPTLNGVDSAH